MNAQQTQADFQSNLQGLLPANLRKFAKLEPAEPYHLDHWAQDHSGSPCMYYWFSSHNGTKRNRKRVIISEVHAAFQAFLRTGAFDRNAFRAYCPKSESSGRCGFVVVVRIFEALGEATYSGRE